MGGVAHAQRQRAKGVVGKSYNILMLLGLMGALSACSNGANGVRFTNGGTGTTGNPQAQPIRALSSSEVNSAISGKTFQYTRADGNGFVTYNSDGTFSFQDDVKGEGTGRWAYEGGKYCETFGPTAQQECGEFRTTGDAYFAAKSRLVEMKG
jgi:hypothetical protein